MATTRHRLRKYVRKKAAALRRQDNDAQLTRVMVLYWRYHRKVYGSEIHLWGKPVSNGKPAKL